MAQPRLHPGYHHEVRLMELSIVRLMRIDSVRVTIDFACKLARCKFIVIIKRVCSVNQTSQTSHQRIIDDHELVLLNLYVPVGVAHVAKW